MITKQRGSGWSIKLAFNLYKLFGYRFIYITMYAVTFFYFIFASNVKESLKLYYKNLNLEFNNWVYFEHLRMFAMCMCDRFISKHDPDSYKFIYDTNDPILKIMNSKSILLFSHFGGWASSSCNPPTSNTINIVMKEVILESIKNIENSIKIKKQNVNIIDLSLEQPLVSIKIANAISNNEIIAIMADRPISDKYKFKTIFFNKNANFNRNPFKIAYVTKTPLISCFIINKGLQKYEVKTIKIDINYNLKEKEAIEKAINEYVNIFEKILIEFPNQWFNFYNFWEE